MRGEDLVGQRFGSRVVISGAGRTARRNALWTVRCDCGRVDVAQAGTIRRSSACGSCAPVGRKATVVHGYQSIKHPLYNRWESMRRRCSDLNDLNYGGRGISVCERWRNSFAAYADDLVQRSDFPGFDAVRGMTWQVDREDVDGNYEPSNVRWTDAKTNMANRRPSRGSLAESMINDLRETLAFAQSQLNDIVCLLPRVIANDNNSDTNSLTPSNRV